MTFATGNALSGGRGPSVLRSRNSWWRIASLSSLRRNQAARSRIVDVVLIGGTGEMGQIFCFALLRRRVRHGALTMRLRSHVRSAVKTASWRAFAAVDTFGLVWLFSGHDTTHAIAAAGAVVGVEAITKSFLYFAHERLWEAPLLR